MTVGEPNGHDKFERTFRFTVSDGPLSQFDDAPPACGANEVCANRVACHALGPFRCVLGGNSIGFLDRLTDRLNRRPTGFYTGNAPKYAPKKAPKTVF